MTGYGKADCEINGKKITVEIKSLNSKQLDLSIRMIGSFKDREMEIRNEIQRRAERGKIEVNIFYDSSAKENILYFNEKVFQAYLEQINISAENMGITPPEDPWSLLLKMPEVFKSEIIEEDKEENWTVLKNALEIALDRFSDFRIQEGRMLEGVFNEKISRIESYLEDIKAFEPERIDSIKARITDSLEKLGNIDYDKNRFEQEMIYYIEKLDVNEEKARLANHLTYFIDTMNDSHGQGRNSVSSLRKSVARLILWVQNQTIPECSR